MAALSCACTSATDLEAALHEEHVRMQETVVLEDGAADDCHYADSLVVA